MTSFFDPRSIPGVAQQALPSVPLERLHPHALRERFARPPAWQHEPQFQPTPSNKQTPVPAAVLVPLLSKGPDSSVSVLLTQRNPHLRTHGGQISFPGGRSEAFDADPVVTALREAHEEVGLQRHMVEVLGSLPTLVTVTGFSVTPVVGLVQTPADGMKGLDLLLDPREVDDVFEVPLSFLMNPKHHLQHALSIDEQELSYFSMAWQPHASAKEYFIWGATAAMLRNLYRLLSA